MTDRRAFTLQPLVEAGVFEPGENVLSCSVGGVEYFADLGPAGEIIFEGQFFKSPSAFSVFVKRKVNPSRKADDGWTSCKYRGELLSIYRPQLENLLGGDGRSGITASPLRSHTTAKARKKRTARKEVDSDFEESSYDDGMEPSVGPGMDYSGRLSPGPYEGNGYGDAFTTTSVPSPRRTRGRSRNVVKVEDDGMLDEEVDGGQQNRRHWHQQQAIAQHAHAMLSQSYNPQMTAYTFVQCENPDCAKWRKVPVATVDPQGRWVCAMNPDPRYASCSVPPQFTDEEIDQQLAHSEHSRHLGVCRRPPLGICTEAEFEEDLYLFLTQRGEGELANDLRNKRINCNNLPIDIFGLYREVVRHGGFVDNERYDDYNRWTGGINFGGKVFPRMKNYTPYNRATSVGNQLLNNYRKFLLAYEVCHRSKDLAGPVPTPSATNEPTQSDALAVLADVAGSAREEMEVAGQLQMQQSPEPARAPPQRARSKRGGESFAEEDNGTANGRKRSRAATGAPDSDASQRFITGLRKIEFGSGRYPPGSLLLAQDPVDLNRHWPVVVAAVADLPRAVAAGGCAPAAGVGFPTALADASAKCRPEEAYPVVVMGTQMMGWVETGSCRRYSQSAGDSALASLPPPDGQRGAQPQALPGSDQHLNFLCAKALKVASQYSASADPQQAVARGLAQAAGATLVAERLLELEARLPGEGSVCTSSFGMWQSWRKAVQRADSANELVPQVLALAHQLNPSILRRGAGEALWDELRYLLDMQPAEPPALDGVSAQSPAAAAGPSVLGVDAAVSALTDAVDWTRLRHFSLPAANSLPTPGGQAPRLRNGMKPSREPLKHAAINAAYDDSRAVSPSSPGHGAGGLPPAHRRVMREAEPANSGHSGHTPRAQALRPEHPDAGAAGPHSVFDFQQGGAEGRPVVPRGARGGGGTSRLQPASRDASFGSGASREPQASPPPPQRPTHIGSNLRSGSFKFAQVLPHDGGDYGGDAMRPAETPRYPGEPRTGAHDPFRNQFSDNARGEYEQQQDPGAAEQHASFGGELVGGNDTDDDPAAANMDADMDIEGDASGAAGGSADNNQGGAAKPDSFSTGSAYPREAEGEDPGEPGDRADEADGEGPPSGGAKDAVPLRVETQPPIRQYPLMREV
ncbi:g5964 [Coccomyxa elongata]